MPIYTVPCYWAHHRYTNQSMLCSYHLHIYRYDIKPSWYMIFILNIYMSHFVSVIIYTYASTIGFEVCLCLFSTFVLSLTQALSILMHVWFSKTKKKERNWFWQITYGEFLYLCQKRPVFYIISFQENSTYLISIYDSETTVLIRFQWSPDGPPVSYKYTQRWAMSTPP